MAWIDGTYLTNAVGSGTVTALGLSGSVLTQYELSARSTVVSVLLYAGYADPGDTLTSGSTSTGFLQKLCSAVLLRDAFKLRKGISISGDVEAYVSEGIRLLDAVYNKKLPIPGLTPAESSGYGGSKFSSSTTAPTVWGRSDLRGF